MGRHLQKRNNHHSGELSIEDSFMQHTLYIKSGGIFEAQNCLLTNSISRVAGLIINSALFLSIFPSYIASSTASPPPPLNPFRRHKYTFFLFLKYFFKTCTQTGVTIKKMFLFFYKKCFFFGACGVFYKFCLKKVDPLIGDISPKKSTSGVMKNP